MTCGKMCASVDGDIKEYICSGSDTETECEEDRNWNRLFDDGDDEGDFANDESLRDFIATVEDDTTFSFEEKLHGTEQRQRFLDRFDEICNDSLVVACVTTLTSEPFSKVGYYFIFKDEEEAKRVEQNAKFLSSTSYHFGVNRVSGLFHVEESLGIVRSWGFKLKKLPENILIDWMSACDMSSNSVIEQSPRYDCGYFCELFYEKAESDECFQNHFERG